MSSNKGVNIYGRPIVFNDISFFDILKKEILKVEEICLRTVITGLGSVIGFPTIPFRN